MRKPSGSIRCWCGGRENCNDPETSRDLYEAFTEGDNDAVDKISEWLKSEKDESCKFFRKIIMANSKNCYLLKSSIKSNE